MEYTSRVPRVTISPVLAPLRSIRVLMAVVEPWINSPISARSTPLMGRQSTIPLTSCAGVVRVLAWANRPVASSKAIKSVKVPPISIATRNRSALLGILKRYHGAMSKVDARRRCPWCLGSAQYLRYHDEEWGVPVHDDRRLFEFLILEGAQAGLSWSTILGKRGNYRRAFARFDPAKVARFGAREVNRLMADAGIVRNRLKIESAIGNARAFLEVRRAFGSFDAYLWGFVDGRPLQTRRRSMKQVPARTPVSDALSKDLKRRGFRFVGSTIVYAFMQAVGMVNDHLTSCFRRAQLRFFG